MAEPDNISMSSRIQWIRRHLRPTQYTLGTHLPASEVTSYLAEKVQQTFPSPRGQLVVAGRVFGSTPARFRIRVFPHGARAGLMYGGNQGDWMKPTLVGTVSAASDNTCSLTYRVGARGIWVVRGIVILAVASILVAIGFGVSGAGVGALIALAVTAGLVLVFNSLLWQTDQGIREEGLLLDWITAEFESFT